MPTPVQPAVHPAQVRFNEMLEHFDSTKIIDFAVRDGYAPDRQSAEIAYRALLQWLAAHAVEEHRERPFVMMNGPVDQMYHAFMLNTRAYLHFCREHIGFFIHHTPVDDDQASAVIIAGGIDYTVNYLKQAYGTGLALGLVNWELAHARGELTPTSVSCVGNGTDHAPDQLLGIQDFRTFWDTNPTTAGHA